MSNKLGTFLIGGVVGAAIALLYAPRTGQETRAIVTEKMNEAWGGAQEFGSQASTTAHQAYQEAANRGQVIFQDVAAKSQEVAQTVAARGQEVAQTVATKGQELYGQAQSRVQEAAGTIKPVFTEKNDDLREKIEAARQRIAEQVTKNAASAQEAVGGTIPVEAEAVQGEAAAAVVPEAAAPADTDKQL